jgi:hypothetical protein
MVTAQSDCAPNSTRRMPRTVNQPQAREDGFILDDILNRLTAIEAGMPVRH